MLNAGHKGRLIVADMARQEEQNTEQRNPLGTLLCRLG